ncbi:hypothetical protein [Streptomyces sp. NPDC001508]|uniref:hypothetical protein n=1 Tax=Streptomyces sp. NPDC001508 TaxID=3154656 RepID=UPI003326DD9B
MSPFSVRIARPAHPQNRRSVKSRGRGTWVLRIMITVCLACLALTSCDFRGLRFSQDHRLEITSPKDRSTQTVPAKLSWKISGFAVSRPGDPVAADAGYFVVFLDRPPMGKGSRLSDIGRSDPQCRAEPGCPNAEYLAQQNIYPTRSSEVSLASFPVLGGDQTMHTAWVILVDSEGRRTSESQWKVTFGVRLPGEDGS